MSARTKSDAMLLALAFAGGVLDVASYIGLGRVFTANMTGNTVLLTVNFAQGNGADVAHSAVALGGFCVGAGIGALMMRSARGPWPGRARAALAFEALMLLLVLVLWEVLGELELDYLLIAIAAAGMGSQSAVVHGSDIRGVNTTYMTGTLLNAIVRLVQRRSRSGRAEEGPSLPGAAWATYALGALAGAFAYTSWRAATVSIPVAIVAAITVSAFRDCRRAGCVAGDQGA